MTGGKPPTLQPVGDSALLVGFSNEISEAVHDRVLNLVQSLDAVRLEGVREIVSGYRTVLVHYDPLILDYESLSESIGSHIGKPGASRPVGRHWQIPAWYGGPGAYDLDRLAREKGLGSQDVIDIHRQTVYRVYMVGFAPGWTFLGGLDPRLHTPRLETPRMEVPAGCISIGGQQTLVGGPSMPSGWNLIGQTPERLFAPGRDEVFFLSAGDRVSFHSIGPEEFERLFEESGEGRRVSTELPWS